MSREMEYDLEKVYSFFILVGTFGFALIGVSVQHSMTTDFGGVKRLKKVTYSDFRRAFLSARWTYDPRYPSSLFGDPHYSAYFHASIIEFNGTGYLFTTYGWIRAKLFVRKYISKNYPSVRKQYIN